YTACQRVILRFQVARECRGELRGFAGPGSGVDIRLNIVVARAERDRPKGRRIPIVMRQCSDIGLICASYALGTGIEEGRGARLIDDSIVVFEGRCIL